MTKIAEAIERVWKRFRNLADGESFTIMLTEIDRLRAELRWARDRLKPYVIADTFDGDLPSDPGPCWEARTDRLCGGTEKGAAG